MILPLLLLLSALVALPAHAQHAGHHDHSMGMPKRADAHASHRMTQPASDPHGGHRMAEPMPRAPVPGGAAPAAALSGPENAADTVFDPARMKEARERLHHEHGGLHSYAVVVEQLEARFRDGKEGYLWDAEGWYGGDMHKLWIKTEGEGTFGDKVEEVEVQLLWSRAITPWFDLQAGLRYDFRPEPERGYAVVGIDGLAPYLIELGAAAFLSHKGDLTARIEAEYDLPITQRLVLQPRAEINLAAQDVEPLGIGAGISDVELGARLRYEFAREFAPYVGVSWERKLFDTADFARDEGEDVEDLAFVAGVRFWF